MACARAAELLSLSIRQVKRLKKRLREDGEAALAHANRGRPSPHRLPAQEHRSILRLARTTYAGFNDHHLCEKLCEVEGFSLSRETLRRLSDQTLRQAAGGVNTAVLSCHWSDCDTCGIICSAPIQTCTCQIE
jgi:hypothetical protein